jgi:hypothetical protein
LNRYHQAFAGRDFIFSAELPLKPNMSAPDVIADAQLLYENVDGII